MSNSVLAKMAVQISGNTAQFNKSMAEASKSMDKFGKEAKGAQNNANGFSNALKGFAALGIGAAIASVAKKIFELGVAQEQLNIAFTTFLGSGEKARLLLSDLTQFSIVTPFSPDQVNNAAKALLSFGVEGKDIIPTLKQLGDVSSGTGKDLTEMAIIFGQIRSTGRLMGQDLLQLINAGFNPLQIISEKTGQSVAVLKKEMEQGKISFEQVADAFKTATSEGGLFFNLMESQSKTIGGVISTIAGNIEEGFKNIFSANSGIIKDVVDRLEILSKVFLEFTKTGNQYANEQADKSLKKFRDRLVEIETQFKSTNKAVRENARILQNEFAPDVIKAINDIIEEQATLLSDYQKGLVSKSVATLRNSVLEAELKGFRALRDELFKLKPAYDKITKAISDNSSAIEKRQPSVPDLPNVGGGIAGVLSGMTQQSVDQIQSLVDNLRQIPVVMSEVKTEIEKIDIGGLIAGGIADIADAFGQAIGGGQDFGKSIIASLASFAQQFGALLIATGIAKVTFDKFSGPGMIAAGAALVALGGAVKSSISKRPNLGGSGGGSVSRGQEFSQQSLLIEGQFKIEGRDLVLAYNKNSALDAKRKA